MLSAEAAFPFCLLPVSLEMGDVPLVSVMPENLQLPGEKSNRGQLITHLQELLEHWVLWAAVKRRWLIVGKEEGSVSSAGTSEALTALQSVPQPVTRLREVGDFELGGRVSPEQSVPKGSA